MIPQSLVFLLTYKCNFNCDHCSICAGPNNHETISESIMKKAIEQAYYIPSIRAVIFTGGESTLHLELLKKGIRHAHEKSFLTRMVTNAWWAKTYEKAKLFLEELASCGLKELNVSYDDFHAPYLKEFGGEQNVINAVRAATELGLTVLIGLVLHTGSKINSTYLRQVFNNAGIKGDVKFLEDFVFPLGRARQKLTNSFFVSNNENGGSGACRDAGQTLVVLPDGKVSFCCGHAICTEAQELFILDNLEEVTLSEMINRMQRNVFSWLLHIEGPESILKELNIEKKVCRNCEACFYLGTAYKKKLLTLASKKEEIFERLENIKNHPAENYQT